MNAKYLIYFCSEIDSVFDSQVLDLLKYINEKKVFKNIYLFIGRRNGPAEELQKIIPKDIEVAVFKSYPNYPVFNFILRKEIAKALQNISANLEESIFHTRGELLSWHLLKTIDKKYHNNILPDIRGTSIEEVKEYGNYVFYQKYFKIWNYKKAIKSIRKLKKITVVSETLKMYLVNNYKMNSDNIYTTPCLAGANFKYEEKSRLQIRHKLNLNNEDILIIFSTGGLAEWQNNDTLRKLADKGMKILNLSRHEIKHKNIINKFVEYEDVPLYLNGADIAVIFRDKSIVNQVASPVKFSEYICCGLPVIANSTVDLISDYVTKSLYGLLINKLDDINNSHITRLTSLNRQEIAVRGAQMFGIQNISEKYLNIYSSYLQC